MPSRLGHGLYKKNDRPKSIFVVYSIITNYVILHLRCFVRAAPYIVVYQQRPHSLFVTSHDPEAGQKQDPGRYFARARDLAKDIALGNSQGQTVHMTWL